jgi:hypothetical protein
MASAAASGTGGLYGPADQYDHSKVAQFIGRSRNLNIPPAAPLFGYGLAGRLAGANKEPAGSYDV